MCLKNLFIVIHKLEVTNEEMLGYESYWHDYLDKYGE